MQLLQPLAIQYVGLAPRHVLDAPRVHQHHLESPFLQNSEQRNPIHAGRLHDHGLHAALGQPVSQMVQVRREDLKLLPRLLRPVGESRRNGWWRPRRHLPHPGLPGTAARADAPASGSSGPPSWPAGFALLWRVVIISSCHVSVGASPEEVADSSHSPERDRPDWGVTNDAAVRLPDHALSRAICAKAKRP